MWLLNMGYSLSGTEISFLLGTIIISSKLTEDRAEGFMATPENATYHVHHMPFARTGMASHMAPIEPPQESLGNVVFSSSCDKNQIGLTCTIVLLHLHKTFYVSTFQVLFKC